jgi:transcriptional regulator with XRE-family HTH domain
MDKDISTLLREIKDATSWSEPKLAGELGIAQSTVNRILNGQDDCKVSTFRAITSLHVKHVVADGSLGRRKEDPPIVHSR